MISTARPSITFVLIVMADNVNLYAQYFVIFLSNSRTPIVLYINY